MFTTIFLQEIARPATPWWVWLFVFVISLCLVVAVFSNLETGDSDLIEQHLTEDNDDK